MRAGGKISRPAAVVYISFTPARPRRRAMAIAARSRPALPRTSRTIWSSPLPTSAGKHTGGRDCRVNDPILRMPGANRHTAARSFSAQTERTFRKTFAPLGFWCLRRQRLRPVMKTPSRQYREIIIIADARKTDFALRSDQTLIDDVGLIVRRRP